ncbi:hypothetical protein CLOP_g11653, partial [Closterium sp. NIES-67]
YGFERANR